MENRSSEAFQRKPFRSGDSKVITVTGMPVVPAKGTLNIRPIQVDGYDCLLMSSYEELSLYEIEQLPDRIYTSGDRDTEVIAIEDTLYDMMASAAKSNVSIPDGKELVLSIRDSSL